MTFEERLELLRAGEEEAPRRDAGTSPAVQDAVLDAEERFVALKVRVHHRVVEEFGQALRDRDRSRAHSGTLMPLATTAPGGDDADLPLRHAVADAIERHLRADPEPLSARERSVLLQELLDEVLGYGPIHRFLRDPEITEIMVNGPAEVWVEREGQLFETSAHFVDVAHLMRIIDKIVAGVHRHVDEASPMVDARLPDGSRVNVVIPPLAVKWPALTIRRFRSIELGMDDLVNNGTVSAAAAHFLEACVRGRANILVSGGTGSGKTTLLNILAAAIPDNERIITIEDSAELQLRQRHVVPMEARPPNVEGRGKVAIRDLVINSLRMRPDRIIVGEARGAEAIDMLQAMNTGHDGSMTTLHANAPDDAIARLETLVLMSDIDLPSRVVQRQIARALHVVVHISRMPDGARRVVAIHEVSGVTREDEVVLMPLFEIADVDGVDAGAAYGALSATGNEPSARLARHLRTHGTVLPGDESAAA